jgi:argininosuccinate lyase
MAMMEFDVIRLPDGYVQSSSIMPQKRNPVAIEHVRAIGSKALGQTLGVLTSVHNTPFGDINDVEDDLQPLTFAAIRDAIRSVSLLGHALGAAEFNLELLRQRAEDNFITVTELADLIVRRDGLPFSQAHAIVAICVRQATENDAPINHGMLQAAASQTTGAGLSLTERDLELALSAENFVAIRSIYGGPSPGETRDAFREQQLLARDDEAWTTAARTRLLEARQVLDAAVRQRATGPG